MKTINLLKWAAILCITVAFTACSDDNDEVKKPLDITEVKEMKSNDFGTWQYFSFEKGFANPVGTGKADPEAGDDAKWAKRTDWDIAFNRFQVRTNGGASGSGKGAVAIIEGTDFDGLKKAPTEGYREDIKQFIMFSMPPKPTKVGMSPLSSWVKQKVEDPASHKIVTTITPTLCVVKTANGKYVKLFLENYKNAKGQTGYLTFQYVYQNDGTNLFK